MFPDDHFVCLSNVSSVVVSSDLYEEIQRGVANRNGGGGSDYISLIKQIREKSTLSLKQSKDFLDFMIANHRKDFHDIDTDWETPQERKLKLSCLMNLSNTIDSLYDIINQMAGEIQSLNPESDLLSSGVPDLLRDEAKNVLKLLASKPND